MISIVVMLILAGVSLNATVGDNGILSKAKDAKRIQGMAVLEEYLQEKYVECFELVDEYTTKPEMLNDVIPNLLLSNSSTRKYIIYEGKAYYLINKQSLPNEIQSSLVGGDSQDNASFSKLIDVYGVTNDLKVYYIDKSTDTVYGDTTVSDVDPNTPLAKLNSNGEMNSAIRKALSEIGIEVDNDLGITVGNISSLKTLILDGSEESITDISALSECTSLKQLTLKNINLSNINSLEYLAQLEYVYFYNCNIDNYDGLASVYNLKYLYFYLPSSMSTEIANRQITLLGNSFSNATKINNLTYLYIVGDLSVYNSADNQGWRMLNRGFYTYGSNNFSNLTDVSGLDNFASNIKNSIKEMYLSNHKIESISSLKDFNSITNLILMKNPNLKSLSGLENKTSLLYLGASYGGFSDLKGISGCTGLKYILLQGNSNLKTLEGIESSSSLVYLFANDCKLSTVAALGGIADISGNYNGLDNLTYLTLANNSDLINVKNISKCDRINNLYLAGCKNMDVDEFKTLNTIISQCGNNYSIPDNYYLLLSKNKVVKLTGNTITDSTLENLRGNTIVTRLCLSGCTSLSDEKLNSILSTMTNLKYLQLYNCSNLKNITFVDKMNLIELDLYGTSVVDLSPLNDSSSGSLATLRINNSAININSYTTLLTNLCNNSYKAGGTNSWINKDSWNVYGLIYNVSGKTIVIPSGVTSFYSGSAGSSNVTYDLSACTNLTYVHLNGSSCKYILPVSLKELFMEVGGNCTFDFSRCVNLTTISRINGATDNAMNTSFATMPVNNKLTTLRVIRSSLTKLEFLEKFNTSSLTNMEISGWSWNESITTSLISTSGIGSATALKSLSIKYTYLNDLTGVDKLKNLTDLTMTYNKLTDISNLSGCTNLKNVNLSNNTINNISSLKEISTINSLNLSNNKIANLIDFSKLVSLNTLNLSTNSISNLSNLLTLIHSNTTVLKNLNISSNPIEDYAPNGDNNHDNLLKIKSAGCTTITASETSLSSI